MQKAWQAGTFVDFGQKNSGQHGRAGWGGAMRRTALAWGLAQFGRGRGACTQYDPKVILGAKTLGPEDDAYYGS